MTEEHPIVRYARLHALHDALVDTANRVIELADMPDEHRLGALSSTAALLPTARHIHRLAIERWQGFPMSHALREAVDKLAGEIDKLTSTCR